MTAIGNVWELAKRNMRQSGIFVAFVVIVAIAFGILFFGTLVWGGTALQRRKQAS